MALLSENSVVDNLNSQEKKRPLSARCGRVLADLISQYSKKFPYDSGWVDLTDSLIECGLYDLYYSDQPVRIRRYGPVVYLYAEVKKIKAVQPGGQGAIYKAFEVPEQFRPDHDVRVIVQGSGMKRAVARVLADGTFTFDRFGITTADDITVGTWLSVSMTWMIAA